MAEVMKGVKNAIIYCEFGVFFFLVFASPSDSCVAQDLPSKKFQSQFEAVDNAMPFARYRPG